MEGFDVSLLDTEEFLTIFDLAEGCIDIIVSFLWAPSETCTLMAVNTFFLSRIRKYHLRRAQECLERKWCREYSDGETSFSILRRAWAAARQPRIVLVGGNQMDRLTECFEVCIHTHASRRDCHEEGNEEDEHEIIFPVGPGEDQHEHDAPNASASVSPAPAAMHLRRCEILPTCHFKFSEKHAVCSHNGHVWVVGGFPNGTSVCILDYITKQWRLGPCLPTVMLSTSLVCLHDALYIIGGYDQHRRLSEVLTLTLTLTLTLNLTLTLLVLLGVSPASWAGCVGAATPGTMASERPLRCGRMCCLRQGLCRRWLLRGATFPFVWLSMCGGIRF